MDLKKIYQKYLRYSKESFLKDANVWVGVEDARLSNKDLERIFYNYEKNEKFNDLVKHKKRHPFTTESRDKEE